MPFKWIGALAAASPHWPHDWKASNTDGLGFKEHSRTLDRLEIALNIVHSHRLRLGNNEQLSLPGPRLSCCGLSCGVRQQVQNTHRLRERACADSGTLEDGNSPIVAEQR
jgi:hypothetical protein